MHRSPNDEAAIERIIRDMTGEQTVEAITAHWDKDVVWFDVLPHPAVGIEAVKKSLGAQIAMLQNIQIQIFDLEVRANEGLGFAFSNQRLTGDGRDGGPGFAMTFRQTDCLEKKEDRWTIVHQHISVPFDPATGLAVLDGHG